VRLEADNVKLDSLANFTLKANDDWGRLYQVCEQKLFEMSNNIGAKSSTTFRVSDWMAGTFRRNYEIELNQEKLKEAVRDEMSDFNRFMNDNLIRANATTETIDEILVTGKYARFWLIQEFVRSYFVGKNITVPVENHPQDLLVGYGAAVKGAMLASETMKQSRLKDSATLEL